MSSVRTKRDETAVSDFELAIALADVRLFDAIPAELTTNDRISPDLATLDVEPGDLGAVPHLSFIDGEHTDEAALADYLFCERACRSNGIIVFHDAPIVYNALSSIVDHLKVNKTAVRAYHLPDTLFVIELGSLTLSHDAAVTALVLDNYVGYLTALRLNDGYRRFANLWLFRKLRHGAHKIGLHRWANRHGYGLSSSGRHEV